MVERETKIDRDKDIDPKANLSQDSEENPTIDGTGVAFSGGGIRSAAFSSGVLRRLLQKKISIDYMSCVSGGGYTGTAYVEWKYRKGGDDDPEWHENFFNQMRENANAYCSWKNLLSACIDILSILALVICVVVVLSALIWIPIAFPLAYMVDYIFGNMLRSGFICRSDALFNSTIILQKNNTNIGKMNCFQAKEKSTQGQIIFYAAFLICAVVSLVLTRCETRMQLIFKVVTSILSIILAFTFLPWFFEVYLTTVPNWMRVIVLILGVIIWMGIPHFKATAAWSLLFFLYSYVIKFAVFKNPVLGVTYDELLFNSVTWACSVLFLFAPFLRIFQQSCLRNFYRCKLQKAFYTQTSAGSTGCTGITCADFFPMLFYNRSQHYEQIPKDGEADKETLTLKDLEDIKPCYVCNVLVDNWTYAGSTDPRKSYTILTITPKEVERIDDDKNADFGASSIGSADIKLSDAMATSGAVASYSMGDYHNKAIFNLQMLFGVSMGNSWVSDKQLIKRTFVEMLLPFLMQLVIFLPLLLMPIVEIHWKPNQFGNVLMGIFIFFIILCFLVAVLPTGKSKESRVEIFTRWCIVNVYQVRFLREILEINNVGEVPPAILYLSDGGHVENLGLLSLLRLRMKRIIIADGGFKSSKEEAGADLLHSLKMAREKLRCSFTGMDGEDINADIRNKFIKAAGIRAPRHFKFKVRYFNKNLGKGESSKAEEGIILFLAPRHPSDDGIVGKQQTDWTEYEVDTGLKLERERWGDSPYLVEKDVDRLTGACCVCCHCACCKGFSELILGRFPHHSTANQFFTPDQFSAYHREGYRSLIEESLDEFPKAE